MNHITLLLITLYFVTVLLVVTILNLIQGRKKKRIKKEFETAYPDEKGLLESNIIHLHLKRHGNGKFVIFGVNYDSVFYVLAFDPGHEFNKF